MDEKEVKGFNLCKKLLFNYFKCYLLVIYYVFKKVW